MIFGLDYFLVFVAGTFFGAGLPYIAIVLAYHKATGKWRFR